MMAEQFNRRGGAVALRNNNWKQNSVYGPFGIWFDRRKKSLIHIHE